MVSTKTNFGLHRQEELGLLFHTWETILRVSKSFVKHLWVLKKATVTEAANMIENIIYLDSYVFILKKTYDHQNLFEGVYSALSLTEFHV